MWAIQYAFLIHNISINVSENERSRKKDERMGKSPWRARHCKQSSLMKQATRSAWKYSETTAWNYKLDTCTCLRYTYNMYPERVWPFLKVFQKTYVLPRNARTFQDTFMRYSNEPRSTYLNIFKICTNLFPVEPASKPFCRVLRLRDLKCLLKLFIFN